MTSWLNRIDARVLALSLMVTSPPLRRAVCSYGQGMGQPFFWLQMASPSVAGRF